MDFATGYSKASDMRIADLDIQHVTAIHCN